MMFAFVQQAVRIRLLPPYVQIYSALCYFVILKKLRKERSIPYFEFLSEGWRNFPFDYVRIEFTAVLFVAIQAGLIQ
jgi:hypothetical protein